MKPEISNKYIDYAANKARSLRALKRTSTNIPTANGLLEPKSLHEIIFGILANRSSKSNLFDKIFFEKLCINDRAGKLNCGCCLDGGCFFIEESQIKISQNENFLIYFMIRFIQELQKIGTVPAMDLNAYLSNPIFSTETAPLTINNS